MPVKTKNLHGIKGDLKNGGNFAMAAVKMFKIRNFRAKGKVDSR